jgi:predicted hotdog family 3-hydroxylacyl-ACP dehydratase
MLLLDTVESFDGERLECWATPRRGALFVEGARVSALICIEYFAQAAAVYCALAADENTSMRMGILLGARRLQLETEFFAVGEPLCIGVRERWSGGSVAQFECELRREGELVASAAINVQSVTSGPGPAARAAEGR